jgi:ribA/ribD-fused uncharacterized protein
MKMRETNTHIYFWGTFLSNWIPKNLRIPVDGHIFSNSEQLYMYFKAKFFGDEETALKLVNANGDPRLAKDLGREVKNYDDQEWAEVREEMMYKAVMAKFISDYELKKKLIDTYPKKLVEGTPFDPIWGVMIKWDDDRILDEKNWKGQNLLGEVLMRVRKELIKLNPHLRATDNVFLGDPREDIAPNFYDEL